jgi:hypothetical protein
MDENGPGWVQAAGERCGLRNVMRRPKDLGGVLETTERDAGLRPTLKVLKKERLALLLL